MLKEDNRRARRVALRSYGLSGDADLASLGEIVDLAVSICDMPMGHVSLLGDQQQWFVVRSGPGRDEMPLEETICSHVLVSHGSNGVVVVEDTLRDPRTSDLSICGGEDPVRFYAAAPLLTPEGRVIGALSVLDTRPRRLPDGQAKLLSVLSHQVMAQLDLRRLLRRADVMRREVDHRVKNSLQSISSLTRLQSRRVSSDEAREALEVVSRRIDTIAALNSELYRSDNDSKLGLRAFLDSVVQLIRASAPDNVTISLGMDDVNIAAGHAGSLAIIVNEFTTNSFKHAFPDGRPGRIDLHGGQDQPGQFRLTCRDDGVGVGPSAAANGLGMSIIDSAVESLGGEKVVHETDEGFAMDVVFGI